jgi:alcohol-forming fatty acyl-CoA reductase
LRREEGLGRLLLLLRAPDAGAAERRLNELLASEPLAILPRSRITAMLETGRLAALAGDLGEEQPASGGIEDWGKVDIVIHCAASVSFEAPLDEILALNSLGPVRLLESIERTGSLPHFVHVSTAYAADCRQGHVGEEGIRHPGLANLDAAAMLEEGRERRAAVEDESRQPTRRRKLARQAKREAALRANLDPAARAEELRGRWVERRLAEHGRQRAEAAGWPDTYVLSKALGEQLLIERCERLTIVRPSIIESALSWPRAGWLEGIKVADPLILAYAARGLTHLPGRAGNRIDIVPVDQVANACVAAALYPPEGGLRQLAVVSGARNPLTLGELAAHTRAHFRRDPLLRANGEPIAIGELRFVEQAQAVRRARLRQLVVSTAARMMPGSSRTKRRLSRNGALAGQVTRMVKIYGPYTELDCVFDDANALALAAAMAPADREELPFDTAAIEWESYLRGAHLPAVHRMSRERGKGGFG